MIVGGVWERCDAVTMRRIRVRANARTSAGIMCDEQCLFLEGDELTSPAPMLIDTVIHMMMLYTIALLPFSMTGNR